MDKIIRARETLTSKERIQKTFAFEKVDRVALGYDSNPIAHENLCKALNLDIKDRIAFLKHIGVDHIGARIPYIGPKIYPDVPDRNRSTETGSITKYVKNQYGGYWDYCDFPLMDVDDEVIFNYPYPNPDDYDYNACKERVDFLCDQGFAIHVGDPGLGYSGWVQLEDETIYVVNYLLDDSSTGQIRGYSFRIEDFLLPE